MMRSASAVPLLEMRDIAKRFGSNRALENVSFDLNAGEAHALVGENGAGKSTLMKVLSGATRPDDGSMRLEGRPYAPSGPRDALARGVAMIYQEVMIVPHLTVEANVMLGQERGLGGWVKRAEHGTLVREALAVLDHAEISPRSPVGRLNLAGRQIVEIARALVSQAKVLVFDEPTSSLNDKDAARLFDVIDRLRRQGIGVVYISHFLNELGRVADRYTVLRDGRSVGTGEMAGVSTTALASLMVGRELGELFPRVPHEIGEPILEIRDLRGERLPISAGLTLRRGEILGVAGLVGAGRTEFLRTIYGLDRVRSGQVRLRGGAPSQGSPGRSIAQGLGFVSEDRKGEGLAIDRSIEDNISYTALPRFARFGMLNTWKRRAEVVDWMKRLRIKAEGPGEPIRRLSGGNQQKAAIGRLLSQGADLLLLDEPTRGIDIGSKAEIYRMIGELAAEGKSILLVSSYLPELMGVCDRIAVMARGVLGPARPVAEWTEAKIMEAATGSTGAAETHA